MTICSEFKQLSVGFVCSSKSVPFHTDCTMDPFQRSDASCVRFFRPLRTRYGMPDWRQNREIDLQQSIEKWGDSWCVCVCLSSLFLFCSSSAHCHILYSLSMTWNKLILFYHWSRCNTACSALGTFRRIYLSFRCFGFIYVDFGFSPRAVRIYGVLCVCVCMHFSEKTTPSALIFVIKSN